MNNLTKENRKEIIKVLNSLGIYGSKTRTKTAEVTFNNFKKFHITDKEGYRWDSLYTLWLDFDYKIRFKIAAKITKELESKGYIVQNYEDCLYINKPS